MHFCLFCGKNASRFVFFREEAPCGVKDLPHHIDLHVAVGLRMSARHCGTASDHSTPPPMSR